MRKWRSRLGKLTYTWRDAMARMKATLLEQDGGYEHKLQNLELRKNKQLYQYRVVRHTKQNMGIEINLLSIK